MPAIVLFGPPACGKGTQAAYLKERLHIAHISTGDLFRENIRLETALGKEAQAYIGSGTLVPDSVTIRMVKERLARKDCSTGFLLDGFPRTLAQAEALATITRIDHAIHIDVPFDDIVSRITGRRTCRQGHVHHIRFAPPPPDGRCGTCGGDLFIRDDDTEEKAVTRWRAYEENLEPLVRFYRARGVLRRVDGVPGQDEVARAVEAAIGM